MMMRGRYADRLWMGGGTLAAALLLAFGWFVLISPKNSEAAELRSQVEVTEISVLKLRHRLTELQEQNGRLGEYQAELKAQQSALPSSTAVPELLRQLERNGDRSAVTVTGVSVAAPVPAKGTVQALPISVTATGSAVNVERFLSELQDVGPRAVLLSTAGVTADGEEAGGRVTLTLTLRAFFDAATGAGAAAPPTN